MRYTQEQENYFKLIILVHYFGANVNRELLHKFLSSTTTTLEEFVNDHQHEIYHFFCNKPCCQCKTKPLPLTYPKVLNLKQMLIIFEHSPSNRFENHQHEKKDHLCCLKANTNVSPQDLDFTLIRFFLVNFCYQVFWDCHLQDGDKTFSAFLEENVHKVYHLSVDKICCCMCNNDREIPDKCIKETQFNTIFQKGSLPCQHSYCSCQYSIRSSLTLSTLLQLDKDLTSKLTRHFCSCRKCLEIIYEKRNKIAHPPESSFNNQDNATFLAIWKETATNILEIAKAVNNFTQYEGKIKKLREDESTDKDSLISVLLDLLKTSEHVTLDALQKIVGQTDSIENKIEAVFSMVTNIQSVTCINKNSKEICPLRIVNSLQDIAIAVCKESTSDFHPDNRREMEVSFNVEIRMTGKSNQVAQGSGDDNSALVTDESPDTLMCGKCKENFTKINEFIKHKETCNTKQVKPAERNSSKKIIYKIRMSGAGGSWKTKALEMNQSDPDCFDTDTIGVCHLEKGCLVVWAESSQSDLENADKLMNNCIQFTQNMFQKCSLELTDTANINVNVKCSPIFEDSLTTNDDDSDYLQCGTCRLEFFNFNSFITHKKECARNRKTSKRHREDISKIKSIKTEPVDMKISGRMQCTIDKDENIPPEIKLMSDVTLVPLYLKLLESGSEKKRDIRLVIVGKKGSGKTSFIKRLFQEDRTMVITTNGIEIHKIRCNANSDDGIWSRLEGNTEKSELYSRLLKPYQETLISHGQGTTEEFSATYKSLTANLDESKGSGAIVLQHENTKPHLVTKYQGKPPVKAEHQDTFSVDTKYQDHTQNFQLEQACREVENMLKLEIDLHDKEEYATILLWDFEGDEEFYHTHQTFLSPDTIYLVVTKLNEADNREAQEIFRLWMDSIHCYSRLEDNIQVDISDDNTIMTNDLDPPVVMVGTWKDAVLSGPAEIEDACREKLSMYTANMADDERGHIREAVFVSNTNDDNSVFRKIRQDILKLARKSRTWNKDYPLKFIQLETRLQEIKREIPIISFECFEQICTETSQPLNDEELILYLKFHHDIRALVYFKDLPDFIILDVQWLYYAFKCVVTGRKFRGIGIFKNQKRWDEYHYRGKLHWTILEEIFKNEKNNMLYRHKDHILKVMEKFDIIIRPIKSEGNPADETNCYYVPSMIKSEPEFDIYKMLNVTEDNCQKSTWLCFKFRFLPPHLINHLVASLCRKYDVAEVGVTVHEEKSIIAHHTKKRVVARKHVERVVALYRGTVVFELQKTTKLRKLLITTCPNSILVQILEYKKSAIIERGIYKNIADFITNEINKVIIERFKMSNVKYEKKWDCGRIKPEYVTGSNDFNEEHFMEFYCEMCTTTHDYTDEWSDIQSKPVWLSLGSDDNSRTHSRLGSDRGNQTVSAKVFCRTHGSTLQQSNVSEESTRIGSLSRFTKEEFNFAKIWMIVLKVFGDVLYDLLSQDKPDLPPRSDCDITYLYREHRMLNKHIPSNRWGGVWHTIHITDIAIGDDIERMRLIRNELQHSNVFELNEKRYYELSKIIVDLLKRFNQHNKPSRLYTDQLNEIVAKTISEEEVKGVYNRIENEIKSEMAFEVEIEHKVNVEPQ